jgi:hypothetical protein
MEIAAGVGTSMKRSVRRMKGVYGGAVEDDDMMAWDSQFVVSGFFDSEVCG